MATRPCVLITGANKGIGLATARELGSRGVTVFLGARDEAKGAAATALLVGEGIDARCVSLDVTKSESIEQARASIERSAGRLDALVNNAGMSPPSADLRTADGLRQALDTNVVGLFAVTLAFVPMLRAARPARVVNITSSLGSISEVDQLRANGTSRYWLLAYGVSKSAANAVTAYLAGSLKPDGIGCVAVDPGTTATDMNAHRGQPPDQAARLIAGFVMSRDESENGGFFREGGRAPW